VYLPQGDLLLPLRLLEVGQGNRCEEELQTDSDEADMIQDMYLKELKAYKVPPMKASDAEGQVAKFSPPAAPKSPEEANLANEMKEYEDQVVEIEGQAATGETQSADEDYFEDLKQFDEEPAHH
jgi:F-type H+-transporting ATPase subunit h